MLGIMPIVLCLECSGELLLVTSPEGERYLHINEETITRTYRNPWEFPRKLLGKIPHKTKTDLFIRFNNFLLSNMDH